MDCGDVSELLPWYFNGTLDEEERERVGAHLESCGDCRSGLGEVRFMTAVAGAHLPVDVVVATAFGEELPAGWDEALVASHLASCARCAEELEMARQSHRDLAEEEDAVDRVAATVVPFPTPTVAVARWRALAAAAALVAAVSSAGWWSADRRGTRLAGDPPAAGQTVVTERIAALEAELRQARAPRLNPAVADLVALEAVRRGDAATEPQRLVLPAEADAVTLFLMPPALDLSSWQSFRLVVAAADGEPRLERAGLQPQPEGDFALFLPLDWIADARLGVELYGRRGDDEELLATWSAELVRRSG